MKTRIYFCCAFAFVASVNASQPAALPSLAPLGLTRLKDTSPGQAAKLATNKVTVDSLAVKDAAGVAKTKKEDVDVVALDANKQWTSKLRGAQKDVTYASEMVYASRNTVIQIGGARLGATAGPVAGTLQLMYDDSSTGSLQWKSSPATKRHERRKKER